MASLGLKYPGKCIELLTLNVVLLGISLSIISITGLMVDILGKAVKPDAAKPTALWGISLPDAWSPWKCIVVLCCVMMAFSVVRFVMRLRMVMSQARLIQALVGALRSRIYDKLQRLSFRFFDANETGSIINRATGDVNNIATFTDQAVIQVVVLIITLTVYMAYMLNLHPFLTLVGMSTTPVLFVLSIWFSKTVRPGYEENRTLFDRLILIVSENAQGQHVVQGFGRQQAEIDKFRGANIAYRQRQRWLFKQVSRYSAMAQALTQVNIIVVLLYGGWVVITTSSEANPSLTVGKLIIFTVLLQQFSGQVNAIANLANTLQQSLTAAGRVVQILDAPLEIESKPAAVAKPKVLGEVKFEHVTFGYNAGEPVLKDISFEVKAGQCVAILGATGAGKSTLLSLISRFYDPDSGRITVDGVDLRDLKLEDLRRSVGLVFQESVLFSNTVANNIAFGKPDATLDEIKAAAKVAAADKFIMEMPKGYDSIVSEGGLTLSGGQRQRISIARAVLLQPSILILDDATAAIDPETEHEILLAMDNAMKGRTTFVVAHRLSTLRRADFIIVLENGRIAQIGTHDELLKRAGRYREIASLQFLDPESEAIIRARQWMEGQISTPLDASGTQPGIVPGVPGAAGMGGNPPSKPEGQP
jgi:ATP-binding cassette, subfamily B, bacterial